MAARRYALLANPFGLEKGKHTCNGPSGKTGGDKQGKVKGNKTGMNYWFDWKGVQTADVALPRK
jgi:hypothetical protein